MSLFYVLSFLCIAVFQPVTTDLTMMLVWGKPTSSTYANINNTLNWDECVSKCFTTQRCVVAWQNGSSCLNYNYNRIGTVARTSSANASIVAFKVENPSDQCPVGTDPPTFDGANATGSLFVNDDPAYFPLWTYYNIYISGSSWKATYKINSSCTSAFTSISERSDGTGQCISAWIRNATIGFTYDEALNVCTNSSKALASLYYSEDLTSLIEEGQYLIPFLTNSTTYARIDGVRIATCQATPTTATCMSVSGFTFTGTPPTNFDNYEWVTNAGAQATQDDNCIVMVFNGTDVGKTDVRSCGTSSPLQSLISFCGGPAWIYG